MESMLLLSLFGIFVLLLVFLYFKNIYSLIRTKNDASIFLVMFRIVGIFIPALGIIMGLFKNG